MDYISYFYFQFIYTDCNGFRILPGTAQLVHVATDGTSADRLSGNMPLLKCWTCK